MAAAHDCFERLVDWRVVVCKQCRHAVWPAEVATHLKNRQHKVPAREAQRIAIEVQEWPDVAHEAAAFEVPVGVGQAIPQLPVFDDGLQCNVEPASCQYICRDMKALKEHWRIRHQFRLQTRSGRSEAVKVAGLQAQAEAAMRKVQCQRFFTSRAHSQYFEVQCTGTDPEELPADVWTAAWQQATQHYDEQRESDVIRRGEMDEVNPWLRRTGWIPYLEGCRRQDLLKSVAEPDPNSEERAGRIEWVIWSAVAAAVAQAEEDVRSSGVMLRLEAVRTEGDGAKYAPLEAYREAGRSREKGRIWQQVVVYFVRRRHWEQRRSSPRMPTYALSRGQQQALDELISAADRSITDDQSVGTVPAALRFCIELLNQTMHHTETEMALVGALAVLGVSPRGPGFRDERSYPSLLSAVMKVAHFMVVSYARVRAGELSEQEWQQHSSACDLDGDDQTPHRHRPSSQFEWVKKLMGAFMYRGTASPAQWMLDLRAYGMKIDMNTTSEGHVGWKDGDTLAYKDIHFNMAEFRGMVAQLQHTARAQLMAVMLAQDEQDVPAVPWRDLFDDPSNDSVGWSFVDDRRTPWPVDGKTWMYERIRTRPDCRRRFVREQASNGINKAKLRDWLKQVEDFKGQLLVLMHITGGQPARGTELLSVRHSNTIQGRHRNVFIEDGMVVFVTSYHKAEHFKADVKIIHRYLPREVGELFVWYRWLVVPFVQRMRAWLWQEPVISEHVWCPDVDGGRWTTERMRRHLERATEAGMGHAINVADYRHIAIAISRKWVRSSSAFTEEDVEEVEGDIADDQATHSPFVAGTVYAREIGELAGAIASRRQQFRTASVDWHRFIGIGSSVKEEVRRGVKRKGDPFEAHSKRARIERIERLRIMDVAEEMTWMTREDMELRSVQPEAFAAIQRGEGKIVVVMPTGAGKSMLFILPAFVGVGGTTVVVVPYTALRQDMVERCRQMRISTAEWDGKKSVDGKSIVLVTPEAAMGDGFQKFLWRVRQTEQLDRIIIDECHVMLGEAGGFRDRLQRLGQLVSAHTQMVLLSATLPPEDEEQLLYRMFWRRDEVAIVRGSTVRPNIAYRVVAIPCDRKDDPEYACDCWGERFRHLGPIVKPVWEAGGKVVVFCNSKSQISTTVSMMQAEIEVPFQPFHRDISDEARAQTLRGFRDGSIRAIAATSMFGLGIDVPDVRLVVHMTMPDNLREYGQESGRVGRDGQPSQAVLLWPIEKTPPDPRMQAFVQDKGCHRRHLDGYLDGDVSRMQCRKGEEACGRCQAQRQPVVTAPPTIKTPGSQRARIAYATPAATSPFRAIQTPMSTQIPSSPPVPIVSSPVRRVEASIRASQATDTRRREEQRDRRMWHEELRTRLHRWKNVCVVCYRHGRKHAHPISRCSHPDSVAAERERRRVQQGIRFTANHVCFMCGLPRVMCSRWSTDGRAREKGPDGKELPCEFAFILVGVVYGIKHAYKGVWDEWFSIARSDRRWPNNMVTFLGLPLEGGENDGCQIGRAFMQMTGQVEGNRDR